MTAAADEPLPRVRLEPADGLEEALAELVDHAVGPAARQDVEHGDLPLEPLRGLAVARRGERLRRVEHEELTVAHLVVAVEQRAPGPLDPLHRHLELVHRVDRHGVGLAGPLRHAGLPARVPPQVPREPGVQSGNPAVTRAASPTATAARGGDAVR